MVNFVKISDNETDKTGRRLLKFLRMGKNDIQTALNVAPFGIDSVPVKDAIGIYVKSSADGEPILIGYLNKNAIAKAGETRFFATDADQVEKNYIYLKKDGIIEIGGAADNMVRYSELETAFNQLKSDFNNFVTGFNTHTHPETGATTAPPTTPGQSSNADISGAKIDEIKTS